MNKPHPLQSPAASLPPATALPPSAPEDNAVLSAMGFDPCDIDLLCERSGAGAEEVAALLTQWEIEGIVEALPGGRYQRIV